MKKRILLIGNDARGHAIAMAFMRSKHWVHLFAYMENLNPGIADLTVGYKLGKYDDIAAIIAYAKNLEVDFAIISPEKPLSIGVVDALEAAGIPCPNPKQAPAQIETSKAFTRGLISEYAIGGNPDYVVFKTFDKKAMKEYMDAFDKVVIKPDGLTGGKGVMVQGDHFTTKEEALEICAEILKNHKAVIIEEKLVGEEFTIQYLVDGKTIVETPVVQDYKRRFDGDKGPNTGSMGSCSFANHRLPFLTQRDINMARTITQKVVWATQDRTNEIYRGVLYGGFMLTRRGVKVIEYNARFGDPEALNVLSLLETDFVDICLAIINDQLNKMKVSFQNKATVCKYLVPLAYARGLEKGHPDLVSNSAKIEAGDIGSAELYYSSVEEREDGIYTTSSRAIAVLGIDDDLIKAGQIAEAAAISISGPVDHRRDIGTEELMQQRFQHMKALLEE